MAPEPRCCGRCRLLQAEPTCAHCGAATHALDDPDGWPGRIDTVTTVPKLPRARGWGDQLALLGTALGGSAAALVVGLATASWYALFVAPAVWSFGYRKQFWRLDVVRRSELSHIDAPLRPEGPALVGTAQRCEELVHAPVTRTDALAATVVVGDRSGLVARAVVAAPFWLVIDQRRVLVTGACWLASPGKDVDRWAALAKLGVPEQLVPKHALAHEAVLHDGDTVTVTGTVREETAPELGGYRDETLEVIRGEPGAVAWIEPAAG